jgi:glycosyltransferase involved in cell wall biosynthesis
VNLLYLPRVRARVLHLQTPVPDMPPASYHRALDRADAVICCSDFIRRSFLSSTDYPMDRTHVVYNGADPTAYRTGEGALQRKAWGLTAHDFVLLFAGAIVPEKGVLELVRAFAQARTSIANATLVIAGSGALWALLEGSDAADRYEDQVRQLAQDLPVEFVGALPRDVMPAAFMAADVVVVPSIWQEPLGTVVCEAMAAGRPVIASRSGGLAETVVDGETGILIEPGDVDALAHAIVRLAKDPDLRRWMADAARQRAALFTWRAAADRLRPIYTEILAAR